MCNRDLNNKHYLLSRCQQQQQIDPQSWGDEVDSALKSSVWMFTLNSQYLMSGPLGPETSWPQLEWSPYQPEHCKVHLCHKTLQKVEGKQWSKMKSLLCSQIIYSKTQ